MGLTDDDLTRILTIWVVDHYHHHPHRGLPGGQSPASRWKDLAETYDVSEPPDLHTRRVALGYEFVRTPSKQGVVLFSNHYDSKELIKFRRDNKGKKVRIRIDPGNIGAVSVEIGQEWYDAPAINGEEIEGLSMSHWTRVMRNRTAGIIWELVQSHLRGLKVMFLHLDEAQDLMGSQSEREMLAVVNTLKSVMQNRHWPVSSVLSGLPDLLTLLNLDPQLGRRITPIRFSQLDAIDDGRNVRSLLEQYCHAIEIQLDPDLKVDDFIARLIHAAASEFGILIEIVIGAIEICLRRDEQTLQKQHFTAEFLRRTGCVNDLNPFIRANYSTLDSRRLLPGPSDVLLRDPSSRKPGSKK